MYKPPTKPGRLSNGDRMLSEGDPAELPQIKIFKKQGHFGDHFPQSNHTVLGV